MQRIIYFSIILSGIFLACGCSLINSNPEIMENTVFTAFDTETTGLNPANSRIVEIAAVKFTLDGVIEQKSWLVNPGAGIPENATMIHGITDEMVAGAPSFRDVYREFQSFIGDTILIAHNAKFDAGFIRAETSRCSMSTPENKLIDSLVLFRSWFPDAESHNLKHLTTSMGVEPELFHRALADSESIRRIIEVAVKKDESRKKDLEITTESKHPALMNF